MMKLFNKIFRPLGLFILSSVLIISFVLVLVLTWIWTTPQGLIFSYNFLKTWIPGKLTVTDLKGQWNKNIYFSEINYETNTAKIRIQKGEINWQPLKLFHHILHVDLLKIANIQYEIKSLALSTQSSANKSSSISKEFKFNFLKDFPFTVFINDGEIKNLQLSEKGKIFLALSSFAVQPSLKNNNQLLLTAKTTLPWQSEIEGNFDLKQGQPPKFLLRYRWNNFVWTINPEQQLKVPKGILVVDSGHGARLGIKDPFYTEAFTTIKNIEYINSSATTPIRGIFNIEFNIKSIPLQKTWLGKILVKEGKANLSSLGLNLQNIQGEITNQSEHLLTYHAQMTAEKGQFILNGTTQLPQTSSLFSTNSPFATSITHITLDGQNFPLIHTSNYYLTASPNLTFAASPQKMFLYGNILIPEANISPPDNSNSEELSKDVVFVKDHDRAIAEAMTPSQKINLPFSSEINLELGSKVALKFSGLAGQLQGKIQIKQLAKRQPIAIGQINIVNGKYHSYGQELEIPNGRFVFSGDRWDNPVLDITATKRIRAYEKFNTLNPISFNPTNGTTIETQNSKILVGVQVKGTLEDPKLSLFSEPPLREADILSYLLLGRPTNQVGSVDVQLLLNTLNALNLGKNNTMQIVQQLEKQLGIDISFGPLPITAAAAQNNANATTPTAVFIGKALSSRLYLSYGFNILQGATNIFQISYQLSQRMYLQSQTSSNGNGVDLLYRVERK